MAWNYRIILHDTDPNPTRHWYGLHECYYDPIGWTENPTTFVCDKDEGLFGIISALEMAIADLKKHPTLIESDLLTWDIPKDQGT